MTNTQKFLSLSVLFSVMCGVFCALVRCGTIFDDPFKAFYWAFIICGALIAAAAYFVAAQSKAEGREDMAVFTSDQAAKTSAASHSVVVMFAMLLGAGLLAICAVRGFVIRTDKLSTIIAVFAFAAAFTLALRALNKEQSEKTGILSVYPIYYLCLYLLLFYRDTATGANIDVYGPQTITLSVLIFAAYFNSAVKFERRAPMLRFTIGLLSLTVFVSELAGYIIDRSTLTCVDPAFFLTMVGGFTIYFVASLYTIPLRLFRDKKKKKADDEQSSSADPPCADATSTEAETPNDNT